MHQPADVDVVEAGGDLVPQIETLGAVHAGVAAPLGGRRRHLAVARLQVVAERARLAKEAEAQAKKAGGKAAAKKAPAAEKPAAAEKEAAEVVDKKGAVAMTETKEVVEKGAGRQRKDRGGGAEAAESTYEEFGELLNSSRRRDSQRNRTWHDEDE